MTARRNRRSTLIAQAHWAARRLGLDDEARRAAQLALVGKASCRDMSEAELARVIQHYHRLGSGVTARAPDGDAPGMVSRWQLATLERLALDMGWTDGLSDARLVAFVRRTARVDRPAWLTREQATAVISGLLRWQRQRRRRGEAT